MQLLIGQIIGTLTARRDSHVKSCQHVSAPTDEPWSALSRRHYSNGFTIDLRTCFGERFKK